MLPFLNFYLIQWKNQKEQNKQALFLIQFKDFIQALGASLSTGYSMENSLGEAKKDLILQYGEDSQVIKGIKKMELQLQMNLPLQSAWKSWAEELQLAEVDQFSKILMIQKRVGGDSVDVVKKSIRNISDRIEVQQEIELSIASKKFEFHIMSGIPIGIIVYMRVAFDGFLDILYGNILGVGIMSTALVLYIGAYLWGRSIVDIEV